MTDSQQIVRANNDPKFYFRFLLIGIALLAGSVWFLYDGMVTWPHHRERSLKYEEIKRKYAESEGKLDRDVRKQVREEYAEIAKQNGWPTKPPKPREPIEADEVHHPTYSEPEIIQQYIWSGAFALIGTAMLVNVWLARSRWIEADENTLTSSWGARIDFDKVLVINKRKWRDKGIAKIKYEQDGRQKTFVLDNYKFERYKTAEILYMLEAKAGVDKIVKGRPEAPSKDPAQADTPPADAATPPAEGDAADE